MDATVAFKQAVLNCIAYLQKVGYTREQAYLLLSAAPIESHVAAMVDIPNACCVRRTLFFLRQCSKLSRNCCRRSPFRSASLTRISRRRREGSRSETSASAPSERTARSPIDRRKRQGRAKGRRTAQKQSDGDGRYEGTLAATRDGKL